ncbi:MAG: RNA polymerase sigma factor [Thermoleophilia bacterium]
MTARTLAVLLDAARDGEQAAWDEIVERFGAFLWRIARGHRLAPDAAADVVQTTWLRLVEHLPSIRDPDRLGGWLAVTARNECLRHLRLAGRQLPSDDEALFERSRDDDPPGDRRPAPRRGAGRGAVAGLRAHLGALPAPAEPAVARAAAAVRGDRRGHGHARGQHRPHPRPLPQAAAHGDGRRGVPVRPGRGRRAR